MTQTKRQKIAEKRKTSFKGKVYPNTDEISEEVDVSPSPTKKLDVDKIKYISVLKAEKYWVERAYKNPAFFHHYILGMPAAAHHVLWYKNIFHPNRSRLNLIAPRESAKSTALILAMAWYMGHNPFATNCIISVSAAQARARLSAIRDLIEVNARYKNIFPDIHVDYRRPNTQDEFTVYSTRNGIDYSTWKSLRSRLSEMKDATMYVSGESGKGIIGRRFSGFLLLDDIIDKEYLTPAAQDKVYNYVMQTLIPCVKEEGRVVNIGTRWMIDDLPERLEKNPEWHTITISALAKDPNTGEEKSYWPDEWPIPKLHAKKREMGDVLFDIMYQSDPRALTGGRFTRQSLAQDLPFPLPEFQGIYIGTDFAISLKQDADFTVFAAIGVDKEQNVYVLDMIRLKTTKDEYLKALSNFASDIMARFKRMDGVVIENVAYQAAILQDMAKINPRLVLFPHPPKGDKGHRVSNLSSIALQGKLFVNQNMMPFGQFEMEALNFPLAPHDDTLDAVTLVLQFLGLDITRSEVEFITSPFML